jgi:hypothetical protein
VGVGQKDDAGRGAARSGETLGEHLFLEEGERFVDENNENKRSDEG